MCSDIAMASSGNRKKKVFETRCRNLWPVVGSEENEKWLAMLRQRKVLMYLIIKIIKYFKCDFEIKI